MFRTKHNFVSLVLFLLAASPCPVYIVRGVDGGQEDNCNYQCVKISGSRINSARELKQKYSDKEQYASKRRKFRSRQVRLGLRG